MKRRIIIITNPGEVGASNYCEGVLKDEQNYISFFKEPFGGYYSDSEIVKLNKPSKQKVRDELAKITTDGINFSIIVFCGHGWYSTVSQSNIFQLNKIEEIDSLEFRKGASKRIIIEDNCREPHDDYITELKKAFSAKMLFESQQQTLNPAQCKIYYNKQIQNSPEQIIVGQACSIGELAGDSSTYGGYYSGSVLKASKELVQNKLKNIDLTKHYKIFTFPECHMASIPQVRLLSGDKQNPQIEKPRLSDSIQYLPFAVVA